MEQTKEEILKDKLYYEGLVTKVPQYISWHNGDFADSIHEVPEFVNSISEGDKVLAIIAAYNKINMVASYKRIEKLTGLTRKEVKKFIDEAKKNKLISYYHTHDEDTGLLNGGGFIFSEIYDEL